MNRMLLKFDKDLTLPVHLRVPLSSAVGPVFNKDQLTSYIQPDAVVYAIGDMTLFNLLNYGYMPKIAIFDYKTKRETFEKNLFKKYFNIYKKVKNPAGMITVALWNAIDEAIHSTERVGIEVDGEEDLAALPCIYLAPDNVIVIYGIPDKGMTLIKVNDNIRKKVKTILSVME